MSKRKLYFAHPINTYGTEEEAQILSAFQDHPTYEIVNPSDKAHQLVVSTIKTEFNKRAEQEADPAKKTALREEGSVKIMEYFTKLAADCDGCAFLAFDDGKIGAGIAKEIKAVLDKKGPVFEIEIEREGIGREGITLTAFFAEPIKEYPAERVLSVEETRKRVYPAPKN